MSYYIRRQVAGVGNDAVPRLVPHNGHDTVLAGHVVFAGNGGRREKPGVYQSFVLSLLI